MTSLVPGMLFYTAGLNRNSTPSPPDITPSQLESKYSRVPYDGRPWPHSSPSAGVYDIANTSTKLLLLNNRSRRQENRLRGHNDPTLEDEDRCVDPCRHSRDSNPASKKFHVSCYNSSQPYFKPNIKTGTDWIDVVHRPSSQYSETSGVNPKRHTSCGVPCPPLPFEQGVKPQRKVRPNSVKSLSASYKSSPLLVHPQLSKGEKEYLYNIAQLYNVGPLRRMKHKQYTDILCKEMNRGVYTDEEFKKYFHYIHDPYKCVMGVQGPKPKLQGPKPKFRISSAPPQAMVTEKRTRTSQSARLRVKSKENSYRPKKPNSLSSSRSSSIPSSGPESDRKSPGRHDITKVGKSESVRQMSKAKQKSSVKTGVLPAATKLVESQARMKEKTQNKNELTNVENSEKIISKPGEVVNGDTSSASDIEKKEENSVGKEKAIEADIVKKEEKLESEHHREEKHDVSSFDEAEFGKTDSRSVSEENVDQLKAKENVPVSIVTIADIEPIPVDGIEDDESDSSMSVSSSSSEEKKFPWLSPHREGMDRPKSRLGHRRIVTPEMQTMGQSDVSTGKQSDVPSDEQSDIPTDVQSDVPTDVQSDIPTDVQSDVPTDVQSDIPTDVQSDIPTDVQSDMPTDEQSDMPTDEQSDFPTGEQADIPKDQQSDLPTDQQSDIPTDENESGVDIRRIYPSESETVLTLTETADSKTSILSEFQRSETDTAEKSVGSSDINETYLSDQLTETDIDIGSEISEKTDSKNDNLKLQTDQLPTIDDSVEVSEADFKNEKAEANAVKTEAPKAMGESNRRTNGSESDSSLGSYTSGSTFSSSSSSSEKKKMKKPSTIVIKNDAETKQSVSVDAFKDFSPSAPNVEPSSTEASDKAKDSSALTKQAGSSLEEVGEGEVNLNRSISEHVSKLKNILSDNEYDDDDRRQRDIDAIEY